MKMVDSYAVRDINATEQEEFKWLLVGMMIAGYGTVYTLNVNCV
jgi:hypothetical protein